MKQFAGLVSGQWQMVRRPLPSLPTRSALRPAPPPSFRPRLFPRSLPLFLSFPFRPLPSPCLRRRRLASASGPAPTEASAPPTMPNTASRRVAALASRAMSSSNARSSMTTPSLVGPDHPHPGSPQALPQGLRHLPSMPTLQLVLAERLYARMGKEQRHIDHYSKTTPELPQFSSLETLPDLERELLRLRLT